MAEYLIQSETLTGIADKIRPLLGLTGTMTPEQMQINLTTEQANIAAALAALAEKGVEVPEGANSNALAELIAAIEAGGGVKLVHGVVTPTEDISGQLPLFEAEATLDNVPDMLVLFYYPGASYKNLPPEGRANIIVLFKYSGQYRKTVSFLRTSSYDYFPDVSVGSVIALYKAFKNGVLQIPYSEGLYVFKAGEPYYYLAVYSGEDMTG